MIYHLKEGNGPGEQHLPGPNIGGIWRSLQLIVNTRLMPSNEMLTIWGYGAWIAHS